MQYIVLTPYLLSVLFIFAYSVSQAGLVKSYWQARKRESALPLPARLPLVTVQLPVYNERYVIERLIDAVAQFDYPKERLEIQILDDSTDDTVDIISRKIIHYQSLGYNIAHIRRATRTGYKAGALAHGLTLAKGEFVAIFDADFVPTPDFLKKSIPYFGDAAVGVVQSRWGHLNENFSLITRLQAFGLDAHFTVEQTGRNAGGHFINFNGTAGVWRVATIAAAGGWSADTLTEDLDLSYRAQQQGWRFVYLEGLISPAELPVTMPAVKSQQYRWTKGAAECARKNLPAVWRNGQLSWATKLYATFHLLNSSIFVATLLTALLSVPVLLLGLGWQWLAFFQLSLVSMGVFYWAAFRRNGGNLGQFLLRFPAFLVIMLGLSLHNAVAVLEGYAGKKTPFIRTPKFNVTQRGDRWQANTYLARQIPPMTWLELGLVLYFVAGIALGLYTEQYSALAFHALLVVGYGFVAYYSVRHSRVKS
ncbi:glycosyltransferase [Arundinibacter roseus]|uniref:Glycosyltransferase n=1 Tax=Arundinibacter roseus TaxID=2070510 RepID=A0A4V2X9I1_9BACT|nr:glycosyltransferase [Arundinibacter roseus]